MTEPYVGNTEDLCTSSYKEGKWNKTWEEGKYKGDQVQSVGKEDTCLGPISLWSPPRTSFIDAILPLPYTTLVHT